MSMFTHQTNQSSVVLSTQSPVATCGESWKGDSQDGITV